MRTAAIDTSMESQHHGVVKLRPETDPQYPVGDEINAGDHEHPQRVSIGLHPLERVKGQPVPAQEIFDRAEGDVGVIPNPGVLDYHERKDHHQEQQSDLPIFAMLEVYG